MSHFERVGNGERDIGRLAQLGEAIESATDSLESLADHIRELRGTSEALAADLSALIEEHENFLGEGDIDPNDTSPRELIDAMSGAEQAVKEELASNAALITQLEEKIVRISAIVDDLKKARRFLEGDR